MSLVTTATRALRLMDPERRREAIALLAQIAARKEARPLANELAPRSPETHAELLELSKGFEEGMQPVCRAIVAALHAGDLEALAGLKAMLPVLLREVNESPVLSDLLAYQIGKALLGGMQGGTAR